MKYIRTKEYGVCKVTNEDKLTLSYKNSYVCGCLWKDNYKDEIQYADTIEELCDEFVWIKGDIHHCTRYYNYQELKELTLKRDGLQLLGAIWTDKGLIYVAKTNDKGELELL